MKTRLALVLAALIGITFGCGKSEPEATAPDPVTQPEAQAALFQRTADRIKNLIAAKDYTSARQAVETLKSYKLTPEQKQLVEKFEKEIPAQ
jgi:hypothetical protein